MDPATKPMVMRRKDSERGVSPLPPSDIAAVTGESYGHSEDLEGSPLLLQRDCCICITAWCSAQFSHYGID